MDFKYLQLTTAGHVVFIREDDCSINATQILRLFEKTLGQRQHVLDSLKHTNKVVIRPAQGTRGRKNTWVSFQCAQELFMRLGLAEKLRPLLDHALELQQHRFKPVSKKVFHRNSTFARDWSTDTCPEPCWSDAHVSRCCERASAIPLHRGHLLVLANHGSEGGLEDQHYALGNYSTGGTQTKTEVTHRCLRYCARITKASRDVREL